MALVYDASARSHLLTALQGSVLALSVRIVEAAGVISEQHATLLLLLSVLTMPAIYWGFAVGANRGIVAGKAVLQESVVLVLFVCGIAYVIDSARYRYIAGAVCLLHGVYDYLHHIRGLPCSHHVPGNYPLLCAVFDLGLALTIFATAAWWP